jgi:hypothetical protein
LTSGLVEATYSGLDVRGNDRDSLLDLVSDLDKRLPIYEVPGLAAARRCCSEAGLARRTEASRDTPNVRSAIILGGCVSGGITENRTRV